MYKKIFVIRHAKSSWDTGGPDIDRPLNERGLQIAPFMATLFATKYTEKLQMISSPAKRALTTAQYFKKACEIMEEITLFDDLYYGSEEDYLNAVQGTSENYNSVALFGHNPKVENFSARVNNPYIGNVPTCAIMMFTCKSILWSEVDWENIFFEEHFFPKNQ